MYSTVADINAYRRCGLILHEVFGRALAVEGEPHQVIVEAEDRREAIGPFDLVYVCAGCLGTTELVMRSLGLHDGPKIIDNSVYTFPLVYTGRAQWSENRGHLGLANLLVNAIPLNSMAHSAQIQIYPVFDHLWRYYTPHQLWPMMRSLARSVRRRALIARVFLHGEYSQSYAIQVEGCKPATISLAHAGMPLSRIPNLWRELRHTFWDAGFLSPITPLQQCTSSHYAASLPIGCGPVARDASIKPGVYLCDSSVFPTAPAASPTFTIMANARRIAHLSLAAPVRAGPLYKSGQ
jgi:hypothetical protein